VRTAQSLKPFSRRVLAATDPAWTPGLNNFIQKRTSKPRNRPVAGPVVSSVLLMQ